MPLPADPMPTLLRWSNGDHDAAAFLMLIARWARLVDDMADDDQPIRQQAVCVLMQISLVEIPANPFWKRHSDKLGMCLNEALLCWQWSDELKTSADERRQVFGYVIREATDRIGQAVAYLTGGFEFSQQIAREIYDVCHAPYTETVEEWALEGRS